MSSRKTTALVTGASAGIGAEFCRQLAARCDVIIATGRRQERLNALAAGLEAAVEVHTLATDLTTREGITRAIEMLRQQGPVDYLVNNAGFAAIGDFGEDELQAQQAMVDLHVTATLALTRAALPFMRERGAGYIINLSSLASFAGYPGGFVYSASKAFLNIFSEGLQQEVADQGIRVQCLCPGYTNSEFHDRESMTRAGFTRDKVPADVWMDAAEVVRLSLAALDDGPVIVVPGEHNLHTAQGLVRARLDSMG